MKTNWIHANTFVMKKLTCGLLHIETQVIEVKILPAIFTKKDSYNLLIFRFLEFKSDLFEFCSPLTRSVWQIHFCNEYVFNNITLTVNQFIARDPYHGGENVFSTTLLFLPLCWEDSI